MEIEKEVKGKLKERNRRECSKFVKNEKWWKKDRRYICANDYDGVKIKIKIFFKIIRKKYKVEYDDDGKLFPAYFLLLRELYFCNNRFVFMVTYRQYLFRKTTNKYGAYRRGTSM
jgi:hypothetical protein